MWTETPSVFNASNTLSRHPNLDLQIRYSSDTPETLNKYHKPSRNVFAQHSFMDRSQYIKILQQEFLKRKEQDIYYSLRQFALDLEVDFSHLGYVLRNERGFSRKKAEVISRKLTHLNYRDRKKFVRLVSAASGRSRFEKKLAKMGLKNDELLRFKKRS